MPANHSGATLRVCGADFSGARKPAAGSIAFICGHLRGDELVLEPPRPCEDRLDLFAQVLERPGLWGLDFPFALPEPVAVELGVREWGEQLDLARRWPRERFLEAVTTVAGHGCNRVPNGSEDPCFRATDRQARAQSPLKRTNPHMAAMTFAGLRFLAYMRAQGWPVFPFDRATLLPGWEDPGRLAEVYPRLVWRRAGLRPRQPHSVATLVEYATGSGLTVHAEAVGERLSPHECDAVAAVAGLALAARTVQRGASLETSAEERARSDTEGLIVRT